MSKEVLTNTALLKLLGLGGLGVTGLDIQCRVGELPLVTATMHPSPSKLPTVSQFRLVWCGGFDPGAETDHQLVVTTEMDGTAPNGSGK